MLILKIIGIALLSIIGLILVLLLLVLFVPIRYKIKANKDEELCVSVAVTWLLHFINVHVKYLGELFYYVRITLIPIYKSDNLKKSKKLKKNELVNKNIESTNKSDIETTGSENINSQIENNQNATYNNEEKKVANKHNGNEILEKSEYADSNDETEKTDKDKLLFIDRIFIFTEKIIDFIFNIGDKIDSLVLKASDIYGNIDHYIEILNDEKNKEAISLCFSKLGSILRHITPKKVRGNARVGFDDPYNMGQMLTIYGILYPIIHDKIILEPVYDTEIIEGELNVSGRIRVAVLLWALYKIYFNKDVKRMIKMFKKET